MLCPSCAWPCVWCQASAENIKWFLHSHSWPICPLSPCIGCHLVCHLANEDLACNVSTACSELLLPEEQTHLSPRQLLNNLSCWQGRFWGSCDGLVPMPLSYKISILKASKAGIECWAQVVSIRVDLNAHPAGRNSRKEDVRWVNGSHFLAVCPSPLWGSAHGEAERHT